MKAIKKQRIFSRNADYQKFEVLKTNRNKRNRYGEFFVEGVRNLNEAAACGWEFAAFLYSFERPLSGWAQDKLQKVPCALHYELTNELMDALSGKSDTSELMAVVRMRRSGPEAFRLSEAPLLALFDRPSNRGNLGTLIRSCDGLGVEGLVLTGHGVDPYDPDVIVSTMGSFFRIPTVPVAENEAVLRWIECLRKRYPGFQVVGTTSHREKNIDELELCRPTLFMIGNETEGLCSRLRGACDVLATIPMAADSFASSFNVACASTVLFYEAGRQRGFRRSEKFAR